LINKERKNNKKHARQKEKKEKIVLYIYINFLWYYVAARLFIRGRRRRAPCACCVIESIRSKRISCYYIVLAAAICFQSYVFREQYRRSRWNHFRRVQFCFKI
jgi:hypothetical protein